MTMWFKTIISAGIAAWISATSVHAQTPSLPFSAANADFSDAMEAYRDGDYEAAYATLPPNDRVLRDLLIWFQLRDPDTDASFASYASFLAQWSDWPGLDRLRAKAEDAIDDSVTDAALLTFFDGAEIQTGQGAVAYADALIAQGRRDEAEAMLADVWLTTAFTTDSDQSIINAYPDVVEPLHAARADMLLWRWRTTDASNLLPHLDEGQRALVRARMANIDRSDDIEAREALVPDRLKNEAGLQYDRFNRLAGRGDWTEATTILSNRSASAESLGIPWRWGSWRRTLARWQMREGNIATAYRLAAVHYIQPDEANYDDLEWLAGYIALTYLREYEAALAHFQRFDAAVTSPISKGRAGYWLGRAYEGLGNADAAVQAFQMGAEHQTSFYGLLSAERLGLTMSPDIAGGEDFGDWRDSPILQDDRVRAGLALLEAGERGLAVLFLRDAATSMSRHHLGQLAELLMEIDEPFYTVLIAKTAVREDQIVQDAYFPIHPMAQMELPVEPALALSIARQESEFRTDAGSSVGALGLMQLMPGTAQDVAGWIDLPYSRARLTTDWEYNAALGAEYLAYLTREFGDSPVMIAAGYNAGPSRPKEWMASRGDPRRSVLNPDPVNVVDWIEHIPFRETRNYVMRVTEGIPVYRARLTGQIGPVAFTDILVGAAPIVRPVARPAREIPEDIAPGINDAPATPPVRRAGELSPTATSGPQSVRPVARAGD